MHARTHTHTHTQTNTHTHIQRCEKGSLLSRGITPVTYKLVLQWLPSQAPGMIGSALGGVSILWLSEIENLICNFYHSETEDLICNFYQCGTTYICLSWSVPEIYFASGRDVMQSNNNKNLLTSILVHEEPKRTCGGSSFGVTGY